MKQIKKLMKFVAFMFVVGVLFANTTTAEAAISKRAEGAIYVNPQYHHYEYDGAWGDDYNGSEMIWKNVTKIRMGQNSETSFYVYFGREGDYISDVKVNKKGLTAGVTYQDNDYYTYYKDSTYSYDGCYGEITLISQKKGNYTVSFNVRKADGSVAGSYKVKVYAYNGGVYSQAKLGSKVVYKQTISHKKDTLTTKTKSTYKVANSLKSAKLKLTANKGYSITGLVYVSYNANGKPVAKKVKNGRTIKLSQQYAYRSYNSNGTSSKSQRMWTYVYVSYKDKYLGTYTKYSVVKRHNTKMIKCVVKDQTGQVSTSYCNLGNYADMSFWRY